MNRRIIYLVSIFTVVIYLLFAFCTPKDKKVENDSPYLGMSDTVHYVGMDKCRQCHNDVYETFIQTGMGQSFGNATGIKSAARFTAHDFVFDSINNLYYKPFFRNDTLYIKEYRVENQDTVYQRIQAVTYIIGSGQHTNSHLYLINNFLYQAPITFYTQEGRWDLAPGFEKGSSTRFKRIISDECMSCHNGYADFVAQSENKYSKIKIGIDCERCHGPGSAHVKLKSSGQLIDTATTFDYSIVNPRGLEREAQIDVCQRCHLQGISVLNEGQDYQSFKPSMRLKDVMKVFLPRYSDSDEHFIMASQADRMKQSKCFKSSDMTCLSCHNPHVSVKERKPEYWVSKCESCHKNLPQKLCTETNAKRQMAQNNCVQCHMPKSGSIDIPHVQIHDHNIRVVAEASKKQISDLRKFIQLECVNDDKINALDKAKGYLNYYEEYTPEQLMLDSAKYFLDKSGAVNNYSFSAWIQYFYLSESYRSIIDLIEDVHPTSTSNAWTMYRIGEAFYQIKDYKNALLYYNKALDIKPLALDFINKKGIALMQLKRWDEAEKVFQSVLMENAYNTVALNNLGYLFAQNGKLEEAQKQYDKALLLDPDYVSCLINKAGAYLLLNKPTEAKKYLQRATQKDPTNEEVKDLLRKLQGI